MSERENFVRTDSARVASIELGGMGDELELSEAVRSAIESNRKIEAIKILRREQNLGLKEAKDIVEAYMSNNPVGVSARPRREGINIIPLLLAAAFTAAGYLVYKSLS